MPRHTNYVPHGVIPAVLLPFNEDLSIDEAGFRKVVLALLLLAGVALVAPLIHLTY